MLYETIHIKSKKVNGNCVEKQDNAPIVKIFTEDYRYLNEDHDVNKVLKFENVLKDIVIEKHSIKS